MTDRGWDVEGNFGQGWEVVTAEATKEEAIKTRDLYRTEDPAHPYRIKREKKEAPVYTPVYVIKVDGEEIDHADTLAAAKVARDTIIYGGIGTEDNTTIEKKKESP